MNSCATKVNQIRLPKIFAKFRHHSSKPGTSTNGAHSEKVVVVETKSYKSAKIPHRYACIGLNRPGARNALNTQLVSELTQSLEKIRYETDVNTLILHSMVPGVFCAGADLKERLGQTEAEWKRWSDHGRNMIHILANMPQTTIAAVDGWALGGGLELALTCDLRVGTSDTMIGLPETSLAIIPGLGATQRLPRMINPSIAKQLIYTGRRIRGNEAYDIGIINILSSSCDHSTFSAFNAARKFVNDREL